jgi:hypothetical protein
MNRLLQNKWFVSLLGVAALLLVVVQFRPSSPPGLPARTTASRKKSPPAPPPRQAGPKTTPAPAADQLPAVAAERDTLAARFAEWRDAPRRDPFDSGVRAPRKPAERRVPAWQVLSLTAIWRQTGGSLAVVNNRVVGIQDVVQGYQIQSILPDSIWVVGKNGRERVPFGMRRRPPKSGKNQPGGASSRRSAPRSRR